MKRDAELTRADQPGELVRIVHRPVGHRMQPQRHLEDQQRGTSPGQDQQRPREDVSNSVPGG
jgi:hypothetical protein